MNTHLHLPHPRLCERVVAALEHANERLHLTAQAHTDPAAVARWAEWKTPDEWEREHDGSHE